MSVDSVPKIIHTLEKEVQIIDYAWDGDCMNVPTSMVSSTKHGLFVGDPISHGVIRIHNGHTSWFVIPPRDPVAGDINFVTPTGMAINEDKNLLLLVDHQSHVVRQFCITDESFPERYGTSTILAGASIGKKLKPGFKNGQLLKSRFRSPSGISVTMWDDILVSDTGNHVIRLIRGDRVSTFAGDGSEGFRDGYGKEARFNGPMGIVSTPQGDIFVCDVGNHRIRLIEESGCVKTLAGSGKIGLDDGQHLASSFASPNRLILTPRGDLVVLGHNIRFIQISGLVSTLAENEHPYVLVQKELNKLTTVTKGFKERFNDALNMRQRAPSKTIVKTTKEIKTTLNPSPNDPTYHLPDKTIENMFQSVGDLTFTPTGDLLFSDPETHSVKFIPGLLAALYPLKKENGNDELSRPPTYSPKPLDLNRLRRSFELDPWTSNPDLTETHGAVISRPRFSPLDFSLTPLRTLSNPFYDFDLTLDVRGKQVETWNLHIIILFLMCPSLLLASAARRISTLKLSKTSIEALLDYCYSGKLPSLGERSTSFWNDLHALCTIVKMPMLAQYACFRLQRCLKYQPSIDTAIKLVQSNSATKMSFDVVSEALSEHKEAKSKSPGRLRRALTSSNSYREFKADKGRPIAVPPKPPILTSDTPLTPPSYKMPDCPAVSLKLSSSVPRLIGKNLKTASALAERVHHLRLSRDPLNSEFESKNRVDVSGTLQETIPMLGFLLKNPPPKKESLVPFPELVAPDFFIKVQKEYISCHGCILYARWPWFKAQVDLIDSRTISRPIFAPFHRGMSLSTKAPRARSRRASRPITVLSATNWHSSAAADQSSSPNSPTFVKKPPKLSMLESWSMRISKSYKRNRSVKIPPNTLTPQLVRGLIWYLYSGELSGMPPSSASLLIMDHAKTFGFVDDDNRSVSPFQPLIGYLQQSVAKDLTLDNCFNTLEASIVNGYVDRAQEARDFIAKNMDALNVRTDLSGQLNRLSVTEREAIYAAVPVSRPQPGKLVISSESNGTLHSVPMSSKVADDQGKFDFSKSESSPKASPVLSKIIDDEGNSECSSEEYQYPSNSLSVPNEDPISSRPEPVCALPISERGHPSTRAEYMKKKLADMSIAKVSQTGKEPSDVTPPSAIQSCIPRSNFYLTPSPPSDPRNSMSLAE